MKNKLELKSMTGKDIDKAVKILSKRKFIDVKYMPFLMSRKLKEWYDKLSKNATKKLKTKDIRTYEERNKIK